MLFRKSPINEFVLKLIWISSSFVCATTLQTEYTCLGYNACFKVPKFELDLETCSCSVYGFESFNCAEFLYRDSVGLAIDASLNISKLVNTSFINSNSSILETFMTYMITNSQCARVTGSKKEFNITMIRSCPRYVTNTTLIGLCGDSNSMLPPVEYNKLLPVVFQNIHCAVCHGLSEDFIAKNLLLWKLRIVCENSKGGFDWKEVKKKIKVGECLLKYDPPIKELTMCNQGVTDSVYNALTNDCIECINTTELNSSTTRNPCFVCRFALVVSRHICFNYMFSDTDLTTLFQMPTELEVLLSLNGDLFKASDMCDDDEQFDLLLQTCRKIICSPIQYASRGRCINNATLFISPELQPLPNGTEMLYLTIIYYRAVDVKSLEYFSIEYFLQTLTSLLKFSGRSNAVFVNKPTRIDRCTQMAVIKINNMEYLTVTNLLQTIGSLEFEVFESEIILQVTNFPNGSLSRMSCDGSNIICRNEASIYPNDTTLLAKLDYIDENITLLLPLNNILFNLVISSRTGYMNLTEICFCEPQFDNILNCSALLIQYEPHEYILNGEEELIIIHQNLKFQPSEYQIKDSLAIVCYSPEKLDSFFNMDPLQNYVSWACSAISVVALLITVVVFFVFSDLRNLPGKLTFSLSISLIFGQSLLLFPHVGEHVCRYLAALTHFCWLSAFLWMGSQACNMLITFHPKTMQGSSSRRGDSVFKTYCSISLLSPGILCITLLILDVVPGNHLHVKYGVFACTWMADYYGYILTFFVPVGLILVANIICFSLTWYHIERTMSATDIMTGRKRDRNRCVIYIKLSSIMGFSWIFGFIASFANISALWYVYIVLNGLQGLFIFCSFTLNARTRRLITKRVSRAKKYTTSDTDRSKPCDTEKSKTSDTDKSKHYTDRSKPSDTDRSKTSDTNMSNITSTHL